jgi:nitrogenase molybdenum-iron protein alpha/beta subunit
MVGVYLGVNAIPDARLIVDGPDCLFFKAEYVQGTHDLNSDLLDASGRHRVAHTVADTVNVALDREPALANLIRRLATTGDCGALLVSALPMAEITGSQYDRIARDLTVEIGVPIMDVPGRSLRGDWLDGYSEVLDSLARCLPLDKPSSLDQDAVALVGMMIDRTEADRMADLHELMRMLHHGLGLDVRSVWPSNRPVSHLAAAASAGTVLSLPYGRKAARRFASRTGARLVEVPVPFGPDATADFLRAVAIATDRLERAEAFIAGEIDSVRSRIAESGVGPVLSGKGLAFVGDPHMAVQFPRLAAFLHADVAAVGSTAHPSLPVAGCPGFDRFQRPEGIDLCIATSRAVEACLHYGIPFLENGFPSYGTHALHPTPTLGFNGAMALAQNIANRISLMADLVDCGAYLEGFQTGHASGLE